ncbi:MAG: TonB-dependent receptor [Pseudomonadota bacterium]
MTLPVAPLALKPLALALAISLTLIGAARADEPALPTVFVSAARFASDPSLLPVGATVIGADEIRRAGVTDVNQAIRKIGGVFGRQSLDGTPDFGLDLRGFGSTSAQNMVIVIDGVRLSDNELSNAILSSIPIDTVERIEIIRGGASVLFGEGATGGVIQVITRRPPRNGQRGSVVAEAGQFGLREGRASAAASWDNVALDAAVADQHTDNYRQHNRFRQKSFSGGAQWRTAGGRVGLRAESAQQDSDFAGSLTSAQFQANPRQASTPLDFGSLDTKRVTAFLEQRFDGFELAAELAHREKDAKASYYFTYKGVTSASNLGYDSVQNQFSPRLRQLSELAGMFNELVAGVDLIRWNRLTKSSFSAADATQKSKGFYLRDELKFDTAHNGRLSAGARHETFDKLTRDPLSFDPGAQASSQSQNAWEVQGSYDVLAQVKLYAKDGQSYRVPNSDENGYRTSVGVLKIQTSHDLEFGVTVGDAERQLTARLFRHALSNEIAYDPTGYGGNTNLDPTRRQGAELDGHAQLAPGWRVSGHLQHVKADFTAGPNSGKELILVPKNILSARLAWVPGDGQSADLGAQWVDSQRVGNDFANTCATRIPSATTFDGRYGRSFGAWEFAISGVNLTDKHYYSNAFGCNYGIYPSDGRQLKVSARYDF